MVMNSHKSLQKWVITFLNIQKGIHLKTAVKKKREKKLFEYTGDILYLLRCALQNPNISNWLKKGLWITEISMKKICLIQAFAKKNGYHQTHEIK